MPDTHNKIIISVSMRAAGDIAAARDLINVLDQIARKLNAVDALDSGTATAATIVQALQK